MVLEAHGKEKTFDEVSLIAHEWTLILILKILGMLYNTRPIYK